MNCIVCETICHYHNLEMDDGTDIEELKDKIDHNKIWHPEDTFEECLSSLIDKYNIKFIKDDCGISSEEFTITDIY